MLTRPGSSPGPEWMRKLGDNTMDPRQLPRKLLWIFVFIGILQFGSIIVGDIAVYQVHGRHVQSYNSPIRIGGLPLLSVGRTAHGIVAYGGVATGFIAVGGLSAGFIAFGGLSVGVFAFGGLSAGIVTLGGVALGWRAIGGLALGDAAVGGLAIGRYAYAGGGVALGKDEASGKQKESLIG
jgi:hypothetical protein